LTADQPVRIALNLQFVRPGVTGGGETYAVELARALAALDRDNEYLLLCNRDHATLDLPRQENFRVLASPIGAAVRPVRYAWEQVATPLVLARRNVAIVHSLSYVAPLLAGAAQVVTIPDANWEDLDILPAFKRRVLGFFVRGSAARATTILTGTQAAAAALRRHLPEIGDRIEIVPLGGDHMCVRTAPPPVAMPRRYVLALSGSFAHKNTGRLTEAFQRIADRVPHSLVIVGNVPDEHAPRSACGSRIVYTGYVTRAELASLYAGAELFAFPSWHEGFGLPLVEAQRCGTPVAAAAIPALAEIAAGSAALFDPFSVDAIERALLAVLTSPGRLAELGAASRANALRYSWATTARRTLEIYQRIAA
jgi:glycosyltransferase involved in cell wall biosynthesis